MSYQCGAVDRGVNGMVSLTIHGDASLKVHFHSTGIQYGSRAWSYKLENPRWSGRTPLLGGLGLLRSLLATSVTQMGGVLEACVLAGLYIARDQGVWGIRDGYSTVAAGRSC